MITRLVDVNYVSSAEGELDATPERYEFWLRELRTPDFVIDCVRRVPEMARAVARTRPATAPYGVADLAAHLTLMVGLRYRLARERGSSSEDMEYPGQVTVHRCSRSLDE